MVICLKESGPAADWLSAADVPIVELHKKEGNDRRIVNRIAGVLRKHQIDLVQSHNWGTLVETTIARRRSRTPAHVHAERGTVLGDLNGGGLRFRLRALTMRWALCRANAVMSNAASVANRVEATCGFRANRIKIIPNGVERPFVSDAAEARREVRQEMNIPDSAFVAGSIGRLHPVKGFDVAIEAIQQLARDGKNAHLLLVGDGEEKERLRELTTTPQLCDRVHFAGRRQDVGRWYSAMDVFLNTSHSEGMSQSLVEAMAAGLPLVVTDVGASATLVGDGDRSCGILVPPKDVRALRAALTRMIGDPDLRERMHREAKNRHAAEFAIDRMVGNIEQLYLNVYTE